MLDCGFLCVVCMYYSNQGDDVMRKFISLLLVVLSLALLCSCNGSSTDDKDKSKNCNHSYGEWYKEEPCDTLEWKKCKYCDNKDFRIVDADHQTNRNGVCVNCGTKIIYSQEEVKNIIQIQFFALGEYDGGALSEIKIVFKNTSQKEIDEIFFGVTGYYNGESDVYRCTYPGNVKSGAVAGNGHYYEPLWPSEGMYGVKISSINITYTDGTKERIFDDNVQLAFWESENDESSSEGDSTDDELIGPGEIDENASKGLVYIKNGNWYEVSGLGTCTDTEIVISSKYNGKPVAAISENAFKDITWITNVTIPNSVTTIGRQAFKNCSSLKELHIPNSVTTIKAYAFDACDSLIKLYLGTGLSYVEEGGFHDCDSIAEVHITDLKAYASINFDLFASPFDGYRSQAELYLNGSLAKNITIPGHTGVIGERAFDDCPTITNVIIESGVTTISDYAFANCGNLLTITIPTSVKEIGYYAFAGGMSALGNAPKLEKIIYQGTRAQWMQITKNSSWDNDNYGFVVQCIDGTI